MKKKISICIPCYNEGENVLSIHRLITAEFEKIPGYNYEIIFEDNCSLDNTPDYLRQLAEKDKHVKVIFNSKNFGAMKNSGYIMFQATGDAIIGMPCDLQTPVDLIPRYIELWEQGNQVVLGQIVESNESKIMFGIRGLYYKIIDMCSENKELRHVTGCGLFDKDAIKLIESLNEPEPNFRYLVTELGLKVALIPYVQQKRAKGKSSYNFVKYFNQALQTLISTSKTPLRFATTAGMILSGVSFTIGLIYLVYKLIFWDSFDAGMAPILIGIFFWGAFQLFFIGILGQYIGEILTRVTKRPIVVERERLNFDIEENDGELPPDTDNDVI
ncbi:MAG: glycosyltransferase family 2 protein [Roseburia sp.]|nr:glycosyltransferase family 2 protein [Roseburia sp.]